MEVEFYIPRGSAILEAVIDVCISRCLERWGGCTLIEGIRYWNPSVDGRATDGYGFVSAQTVAESVSILKVRCGPRAHVVREWFDNLAAFVRLKGDQPTVFYRLVAGSVGRFVTMADGPRVDHMGDREDELHSY